MSRIDELTKEFVFKWERFMTGCDSTEEIGEWNKEQYGEMEAFYENDMLSLIFKLIASDGKISEEEAEYINRCFGFEYTAGELAEVYENCKEDILTLSNEYFKNGVDLLKALNPKLADAYKELVILACEIVAQSDNDVSAEEAEVLKRVAENF